MSEFTLEEYRVIVERLESLREHASIIAGRLEGLSPAYMCVEEWEHDSVRFVYSVSGSRDGGSFPAAWLFDPNWEQRVEERRVQLKADREAQIARDRLKDEQAERAAFERLKKKFEPES